jgi:hypothetical protein
VSDETVDPKVLARAVFDRRFALLARAGVDLKEVVTWDSTLDRRTRLLAPIDVQAFVVPKAGGEKTVPITGGQGDPAPFAEGVVRPPGVHLHWAMPDALLRGRQVPSADGAARDTELEFPLLPDRWVVIRALLPRGRAQALVRGWVVDARTTAVVPLDSFTGTFPVAPAPAPALDRLDAAHGGSLLWTASYTACAGRFGFHDPLDDVAPAELAHDHAIYVAAGWWSDLAQDPLAQLSGSIRLDAKLAELGWLVVHDGDDKVLEPADPRLALVRDRIGLKSRAAAPKVEAVAADKTLVKNLAGLEVAAAMPVSAAEKVFLGPVLPTYATLLHGAVLGVPIADILPAGVDDRPAAAGVSVAVGLDNDDVVAAFGAGALGATPERRIAAERLAAAFTSDLLDRLGSADGIADLEEREHGDQFTSLPGAVLPGSKSDRLRGEDSAAMGPHNVGRKGRGALANKPAVVKKKTVVGSKLAWKNQIDLSTKDHAGKTKAARSQPIAESARARGEEMNALRSKVREVVKPPPRWFRPQPPMLAIRGAHPNHRHHGDGLFENGKLRCRYPNEVVPGWQGVVSGATVVPSLGSGALPDEVLRVVREAVLLDGYAHDWLAAAGAPAQDTQRAKVLETRLAGEMVRLYGTEGRYDGTSKVLANLSRAAGKAWDTVSATTSLIDRQVTSALAEYSLLIGTPPSPVAITTWRQPWIPLWVEWRVTLLGSDRIEGWTLEGLDLAPPEPEPTPITLSLVGRNPIGQGLSTALAKGIERWLAAELQRDRTGGSIVSDADGAALDRLGDFLAPLDLVSASLDGIREQLLGMPYVGCAAYGPPDPDGNARLEASGLPLPLFGGVLRFDELRLVDAFGRLLSVPATRIATTSGLELPSGDGMRLRPRLQHAARWLFRLVDPALPPEADPTTAKDAFVDQLDPRLAINPVAGFLLPDHIDEALECFSVDGVPLGQLGHDDISGAVMWEPAPGRPVPPDAGPLAGLGAHDRLVGELAAGLVRADVAARAGSGAATASASALSALLRAIDSTLWTVDTFAAVGSPTVAGLVGRPVAVVRATLRLEIPDDLAEVTVTHPAGVEARRAAFAALAEQRFPVQLGTLTRADDALLGFFVDDDYAHLHLVDKAVAAGALVSGRHQGQLGLLGEGATPQVEALSHDYVSDEDVLWIRPGQTLRLTLLMLPAGKVHLTSGVLPRKALALADDWVGPGLARLVPSVRVGPVLVDPSEIRLPLVHLLGDKQTFTRRTGPLTWRDDPVLAATQTALLPRLPHEAQEGWIRVTPEETDAGDGGEGADAPGADT